MNKDNGLLWSCMCSLIEILWVLEEKISLNCWQLQHDCMLQKFLNLNYLWTLFSFKLSKLVIYFYYLWKAKSIWKKSKPLKQLFDALETNSLTLMTMLDFFT